MIVVPNVMGLACWSPPLNDEGNSVRGLAFCHVSGERRRRLSANSRRLQEFIKRYKFHTFDCLVNDNEEIKVLLHYTIPTQKRVKKVFQSFLKQNR